MTDKEQQWVAEDGMDLLGRQNSGSADTADKQRLLVVGNGMVGHHFVEQLVAAGGLSRFEVTVFGAEPDPAYDRVHLSEVFGGKAPQALRMADPAWYEESGITLRLGAEVEVLDRAARTLTLANGEQFPYDRLVLATGSVPFVPPIPGHQRRAASSIAPWGISPPFAMPAPRPAAAWSSVAACWGWRRPTPCACSASRPRWWSSPPG